MDHKNWQGFVAGDWQNAINVRDFIQKNYVPYEGDESFLSGATERTNTMPRPMPSGPSVTAGVRRYRVYTFPSTPLSMPSPSSVTDRYSLPRCISWATI